MAFIKNNQYNEIWKAHKDGNEKASMIIQAMRKGSNQEDIDRLVGEYYKTDNTEPLVPESLNPEPIRMEDIVTDDTGVEEQEDLSPQEGLPSYDISMAKNIEDDLTDLLDENDIDDTTFTDYLKNKGRDSLRASKNADYFKMYSDEDRASVLDEKVSAYKKHFGNRLKDIDRRYRDMEGALDIYSRNVNDLLDDDIEISNGSAVDAYKDITTNDDIMHGFGRSWDEEDVGSVTEELKKLVMKYGKGNVIAALNTIKNDNANYRDYLNNQVDSEIGRYTKSIESLLK